jgi:predicted RNase H-like HicB family nuclease
MHFTIDTEQEEDGRWLAEVLEIPGVLTYAPTRTAAIARAQALALRVVAEQLEHDETSPTWQPIVFAAAV